MTSLDDLCAGCLWKECGAQGALLAGGESEDRNRELGKLKVAFLIT